MPQATPIIPEITVDAPERFMTDVTRYVSAVVVDDRQYYSIEQISNNLNLHSYRAQVERLSTRWASPVIISRNGYTYIDQTYIPQWVSTIEPGATNSRLRGYKAMLVSRQPVIPQAPLDTTVSDPLPPIVIPAIPTTRLADPITVLAEHAIANADLSAQLNRLNAAAVSNRINTLETKLVALATRLNENQPSTASATIQQFETLNAAITTITSNANRSVIIRDQLAQEYDRSLSTLEGRAHRMEQAFDGFKAEYMELMASLPGISRRAHTVTLNNIRTNVITDYVRVLSEIGLIPASANNTNPIRSFYRLAYESVVGRLPPRTIAENRLNVLTGIQLLAVYNWMFDYATSAMTARIAAGQVATTVPVAGDENDDNIMPDLTPPTLPGMPTLTRAHIQEEEE